MNNLVGQRFGDLEVLSKRRVTEIRWRCRCRCGRVVIISDGSLRKGNSRSCGCSRLKRNGNFRHGLSNTREYIIWRAAKARCYNPHDRFYKDYGGRGIRMAPEWLHDPAAFVAYVGKRPSPTHTLDRIDNNGDYAPGNVRWATPIEQANNTRANHRLSDGRTLAEVEREIGITTRRIKDRLRHGWSEDEAINEPHQRPGRTVTLNGKLVHVPTWAKQHALTVDAIEKRLRLGWPVDRALTTPLQPQRPQRKLKFQGRVRSLTDWASYMGLKRTTLKERLKRGWSVRRALTEPVSQ